MDIAYDIVFGYLNPGDLITVAAGSAFGTAHADGAGYFFTPVWGTNGRQVDLLGGETIDIYVNGIHSETITIPTFSGGMNLFTDQVEGSLGVLSAGKVVTVSLGIWGLEPNTETPWVTTTTNSTGDFYCRFHC